MNALPATMNLPFTIDQFFDVFGAYNRSLWPVALGLWIYALLGVAILARHRNGGRFITILLAVQWVWAAVAYHAMFFTRINPAAWFFSVLFLAESGLLIWSVGARGDHLHFSPTGTPRHILSWTLIAYALVYPTIARAEGHAFPELPTFGVPCPTTLLTIGFLFAVDPPMPWVIAVIPIVWAFIAGSAALLLGVRADLMLWVAGVSLLVYVVTTALTRSRRQNVNDVAMHAFRLTAPRTTERRTVARTRPRSGRGPHSRGGREDAFQGQYRDVEWIR
jgi:hypothetical protein